LKEFAFPILFGLPVGHGKYKLSLPLGVRVEMSTRKRQLSFLESATAL